MSNESQVEKATFPLMVRLPAELGAWVRDRARHENVSMNSLIIDALESVRAQVGEGGSALNCALGRLFEAVGNGTPDPRWDAMLALLPYLQTQERGPIIDSKARIDNLMASYRATAPTLYIIDPKSERFSAEINPLDEIRVDTPYEQSDAMNLARTLVDEDAPSDQTKAFVRILLQHLSASTGGLTLRGFFRAAGPAIPSAYQQALTKLLHAPNDDE